MNDITLLETALNYSSNIIIIGSSLRNSAGAIENFSILLANRKAEEITGRSASELVGRTVRDTFPAGAPVSIWEEAAEVVETGLSRNIDRQFVLDSGEIRWFSITL
ncbi:MAG: PAS domain-containing protein, partial [Bacteroidetes bacterium]|nr:PAS domain-containing protein [Fibrella sp.]